MTIILGIVTVIMPSAIPCIVLAIIETAKNTPAVFPTYEAKPNVPVAIVIRSMPNLSIYIPTMGEVIKKASG